MSLRARVSNPVRTTFLRSKNSLLRRLPKQFVITTSYGFKLTGNTKHLIPRYVYVFGAWQPDISAWVHNFVWPGDVVIDIGANIGYLSLVAARKVGPHGKVLAIEAEPTVFGQLERNIDLNPGLPVIATHAIAGESSGVRKIHAAPFELGSSSTELTEVADGPSSEVRVVRVDSLVPRDELDRVRLVKIDVEGDEMRVLAGLDAVLSGMAPDGAIVMEIAPDLLELRGQSASALLEMMEGMGFEALRIDNDYHPARYADPEVASPEPLRGVPDIPVDVVFQRSPAPTGAGRDS